MENFTPVDLFDDGNDAEAKESVIPAMDLEAVTSKTEEREVESENLDYKQEDIKMVSDPVQEETAENEPTESDPAVKRRLQKVKQIIDMRSLQSR